MLFNSYFRQDSHHTGHFPSRGLHQTFTVWTARISKTAFLWSETNEEEPLGESDEAGHAGLEPWHLHHMSSMHCYFVQVGEWTKSLTVLNLPSRGEEFREMIAPNRSQQCQHGSSEIFPVSHLRVTWTVPSCSFIHSNIALNTLEGKDVALCAVETNEGETQPSGSPIIIRWLHHSNKTTVTQVVGSVKMSPDRRGCEGTPRSHSHPT